MRCFCCRRRLCNRKLPLRGDGVGGLVLVLLFAGIRALLACFTRRPCAGRHLLFFAAAKKSRQKKAANTASSCICLRAPTGSYTSHGNHVTHARCQRSESAPHPLHAPTIQYAAPDSPPPPRWQTVCRLPVLRTRHFGPIAHASHPVRALTCTSRQPTHSLPPGRHIPFAAAGPCRSIRSG
ncbi:hypothetical protein SAMN04487926_108105 [Paraburkholderia steynii]|uniref:Uncharacterized protein n=1 Tax=Paraburkholderia steynii TaxID=1245441 RepID=A0A7Z7B772_9BURK|nr:hypothetical protein SAMN04487926_108105 [Paraburkholderia steynii]